MMLRTVQCLGLALWLVMLPNVRIASADVDGVCQVQVCPSNSKHPYKEMSCDAPACECWDSCGGSSGSTNGDAGKGYALLIAFVITFPFIPLLNIEMLAGKGDYAFGRPADAKQRWQKHREHVRELEQHGRDCAKETRSLETWLSAAERGELRDAPGPADKTARSKASKARTTRAASYRPISVQPAPRPSADKAQEACSEQYQRERVRTNVIIAHTRFCVCSHDARTADCAADDTGCAAVAFAKYKSCLGATPTKVE